MFTSELFEKDQVTFRHAQVQAFGSHIFRRRAPLSRPLHARKADPLQASFGPLFLERFDVPAPRDELAVLLDYGGGHLRDMVLVDLGGICIDHRDDESRHRDAS